MTPGKPDRPFRDAASRLGAAFDNVASAGSAGRPGVMATAVCSVSDQPPTLIVGMNRRGVSNEAVKANGIMRVFTLPHEPQDFGPVLAGMTARTREARYLCATWGTRDKGVPALPGSLASFDYATDRAIEIGRYGVFLCSVLSVTTNEDGEGLVCSCRRYCATRLAGEAY